MWKYKSTPTIRHDERGFGSIVIAIVFIVVLSLISLGFAQLSRREQTNALDKQLAAQAQYAAESGINDAQTDINDGYINATGAADAISTRPAVADPTHCMKPTSDAGGTIPVGAATYNQNIDTTNAVSYSCLLVTLNNYALTLPNLPALTSQSIVSSTSAPLTTMTVSWGTSGVSSYITGSFPANASKQFPSQAVWASNGYPPVLRVTVTPLNAVDRTDLENNELSAYLYPTQSATGTVAYSLNIGNYESSTDGPIVSGHCAANVSASVSNPTPCSATITGLDLGANFAGPYLISVMPYYGKANVTIKGVYNSTPVTFTGETTIDVTGQAHNTVKRLSVTELTNSSVEPAPIAAIESQNVCKREATLQGETDYINIAGTPVPAGSTDPCSLSAN